MDAAIIPQTITGLRPLRSEKGPARTCDNFERNVKQRKERADGRVIKIPLADEKGRNQRDEDAVGGPIQQDA